MRKKIVAGNWKMNMTPKEAVGLVNKLRDKLAGSDVEVVFCVPAIDIIPVVEAVKDTDIKVGAENMHYEEKGAFTGEISPGMLVDSGVSYVILGHSERRQYFAETDETVNKKVKSKIDNEMAEQEKKLKDSQNQIANGKSQLEEQSKIQKENLVNAEVELQSAKIKLELLASQLTSQGMNKETLNKIRFALH